MLFVILILFLFLLKIIFAPSDFNKFSIVLISLTLGKLRNVTGLSKSIDEASIGRAAFLLPEIKTCPLILQGPLIKNLSIVKLLEALPLFDLDTSHFDLHMSLGVLHRLEEIQIVPLPHLHKFLQAKVWY